MVGREGVFVVIRGVQQASADAGWTRAKVSASVWEVGVRWTKIPYVRASEVRHQLRMR